MQTNMPLLEVKDLSLNFKSGLVAIDRVSFSIPAGRTLGLIGASGAGKSSIARAVMRLIEPEMGEIHYKGQNIFDLTKRQMRTVRQHMQIIFQDPSASLSPRRTIAQTLLEPLRHFSIGTPVERLYKVTKALHTVGLADDVLHRYPHQFSSGQQQRLAIARALMTEPDLLIADEAVAALDVSVQAQILQLLQHLQHGHGIALLFISHDLAVVRQIADEVTVMYQGQILEQAPADVFFNEPCHPYSKTLLRFSEGCDDSQSAVEFGRVKRGNTGDNPGPACVYAGICAEKLTLCETAEPPVYDVRVNKLPTDHTHCVKCHLYGV